MRFISYRDVGSKRASTRSVGAGSAGIEGYIEGKASSTATALSKATRPKTIRVLVAKKKTASLQSGQCELEGIGQLWLAKTHSISSPSQICNPSFVPDSMTHVPRLNANVSIIQRYRVGSATGKSVFNRGRPTISWYAKLLILSVMALSVR